MTAAGLALEQVEVVEMHEAPAAAIRRKRDSSIGRAVDLVKKGDAAAVFSAGNISKVGSFSAEFPK